MNEMFFPQANDLDRLIDLLNIGDPQKIKDEEYVTSVLGGLADRQARYYIHACRYLGFLDENKNFTQAGIAFRNLDSVSQKIEIARIIISDSVIGTIWLKSKIYGYPDKEEIADILKENYPDNSEITCFRRAGNVITWMRWVDNLLNGLFL